MTVLVLEVAYFVTSALFWASGFLAFYRNFGGLARFLGIFYVPILTLPVIGRGEIDGHAVRSIVWIAWFTLEMGLALAVVLANHPPSEPGEVVSLPSRTAAAQTGPSPARAASSAR